MRHLISTVSLLIVAANLLLALTVLMPIALLKILLPLPRVTRFCDRLVAPIYRMAVAVDSFWMQQVMGIKLVINGDLPDDPAPVVICNHQSWFDIPLVQEVISSNGPIVRFLIKKEIVWVPIIGWVCWLMNFPRLSRSGDKSTRQSDLSIIQQASKSHDKDSGALLIFPEGSRFTEQKKQRQASPYDRLLKPKSGGLRVIKEHFDPRASIIDITIDYHQRGVKIWNCLHGNPSLITITLEHCKLGEIDDLEQWLNNRWERKDQLLQAQRN